MTQQHHSHCQ